jgi:hypothetical protein
LYAVLGENTLRCLALATIDKPLAKEKMDLETRDVSKYEVKDKFLFVFCQFDSLNIQD